MVKSVGALLKTHGYGRAGLNFRKQSGGTWAVINFQRSTSSTATKVIFTINLGIKSETVARFRGERVASKPVESTCDWRTRIGSLLPSRQDKWWVIEADTDVHEIERQVRTALVEVGLPEIERHLGEEKLRDALLAGDWSGQTKQQALVGLSVLLKAFGPARELDSVVEQLRALGQSNTWLLRHLDRLDRWNPS